MSIADPWLLAANDPRCILNVSPYRGGTWHSAFFPDELINFYTRNRTWSEFQTWCTSNLSLTDDFELELQFYWGFTDVTQTYNIFGYGVNSCPISVVYNRWSSSVKRIDVYTTLLETSVGQGWMSITPGALTQGNHTLIVRKIGNVFSVILDGITTSNSNGTSTSAYINTQAPVTNIDGNISVLKFTNLTTSEYWEPAKYYLYDLGVMPSVIPRDFSTEPAAWYGVANVCKQISDNNHDWELEFDITLSNSISKTIWRSSMGDTYSAFIMCWTTSDGTFYVRVYDKNELIISSSVAGIGDGVYRVVATKIGTTYTLQTWRNNVSTQNTSISKTTTTTSYTYGEPQTVDGTDLQVVITDLTTGIIVWSYPTWVEKKRLLTLDNIDTSDGTFRGADSSAVRRIKTQIDLRGNSTSKTFICRTYIPYRTNTESRRFSGIITQGSYSSATAPLAVFSLFIDKNYDTMSFKIIGRYSAEDGSVISTFVDFPLEYFNTWIVISLVLDYKNNRMMLYLNGTLLSNVSAAMKPFGQGVDSTYSDAVSIMHDLGYHYISNHQITHVQIFNYAMTQEQISLFK